MTMIPPPIVVSSAAAAAAAKKQQPLTNKAAAVATAAATSTTTLVVPSLSGKSKGMESPPSLSTRPPRWTENEVSYLECSTTFRLQNGSKFIHTRIHFAPTNHF